MKKIISLCTILCALTTSAATIRDGIAEYSPNYVKHTATLTLLDFAQVKQEIYTIPASVQFEGEEYVVTTIGNNALKNGRKNNVCKKIIVPASIREICDGAFREAINVQEFVLPPQLEVIASSTFSLCKSLEIVTLPEGIKAIGGKAFTGCTALKSINIPSSVVEIYGQAFFQTSIKELVLPEGMTEILHGAFQNMSKLQKITIPSTITKIGNYAFSNCERLSEINLPSHIQLIGDGAFKGCVSFVEVHIPEDVTTIGVEAFSGCTEMKRMNFPANIRSIGRDAFLNCISLQEICFSGPLPPTINFSAFDFTNIDKVYVPKGCVSRYKDTFSIGTLSSMNIIETNIGPDVKIMLSMVEEMHKKISAPKERDRDEALIIQKYMELYNFLSPNVNSAENVQKIFDIQELLNNPHFQEIKKSLAKELKSVKTAEDILNIFLKFV